ncbi:triphosphoribosyl-dephospho-CoA synthase [Utexia brackfieldae]|uniref:triphosphoribosyl-dephospho-CoA synthase n=1 Tax=Utexia brackfieldae TaxID=3074108 RepID=UPI00370D7F28
MTALATLSMDVCYTRARQLAHQATQALIDEVRLSPKPGLVDSRSAGAHTDLTLALMEKSAHSLTDAFYAMALQGGQQPIGMALRREIGKIGREGEAQMMAVTGGVNTHRGAIWSLGLLVTALASVAGMATAEQIAQLAGRLASLPDIAISAENTLSKGLCASRQYRVPGAREEAKHGFPHVINLALPTLRTSRQAGTPVSLAQINALLAIMSSLTDTCILSRAGMPALIQVQQTAQAILAAGGMASQQGQPLFAELEAYMLANHISPGGAADLLAATLLLDRATVI